MKPGYQTTEFWLTVAVTILAAISGLLPDGSIESRIVLAILAAASTLGYTISRGIAKSGVKDE